MQIILIIYCLIVEIHILTNKKRILYFQFTLEVNYNSNESTYGLLFLKRISKLFLLLDTHPNIISFHM